jgi:hypothetical protein
MRRVRELDVCIALLRALQAGNEIGPEQKECIELAVNELRKLRRNPRARPDQINRSVRVVIEVLVKAFLDR